MLNYRHLYYFWLVVKEGGFARAAERLDMAVQTISAQVRELEKSIGRQLLKSAGRGVTMTEAGETAFNRAEQIFQIGEALLDEMREAGGEGVARLAVGLSDGVSKLAAHALLAPVLGTPSLRLLCHEGEPAQLLSELALHRLDLVLACQPAPHNADLRVVSQRLVGSPVDWHGPKAIIDKASCGSASALAHRARRATRAAGPVVRSAGDPAANRRRIRRQRVDGGVRRAWPRRVSSRGTRCRGPVFTARTALARSRGRRN
jgi:DNA-binding transcriptional LysR family regulator